MKRGSVSILARQMSWARLAIPSLITLLWVLARNYRSLSMEAAIVLAAPLSGVLLCFLALDLVPSRLTKVFRSRELPAVLSGAILAIPALFYGLYASWQSRSALPWWTPLIIVSLCLLGFAVLTRFRWPLHYDRNRWAHSTPLPSLLIAGLFLDLHLTRGTLLVVRQGAGLIHLGLYVATFLVSVVCIAILATRHAGKPHYTKGWRVNLTALFALSLAGILLEIERAFFVGLYEDIHLWLVLLGLLSLDSGLRVLLASRPEVIPSWLGIASLLALLSIAVFGGLHHHNYSDPRSRATLLRTSLGSSILAILPAPKDVLGTGSINQRTSVIEDGFEDPQYLEEGAENGPFNVLLITIDALRHDALKFQDPLGPSMPNLEKLASEAFHFRRTYAPGSRTAIGMSSLMLGRYSVNIDWNLWTYDKGKLLPLSSPEGKKFAETHSGTIFTTLPTFHEGATLAERLQARGYQTAAAPFAGQNQFFRSGNGFEKGFDRFNDLSSHVWDSPSSDRVIDIAIRQQDDFDEGLWFQWVHLYDPHESGAQRVRYANLLRSTDTAIQRLLDKVRAAGQWSRTMVVVTADHGEALGEHSHSTHATSLYDEQTRVPMIIRIPGLKGGTQFELVTTVDATATIAAVNRASTEHLDGVNLFPLMQEDRYSQNRPVFTELHRYLSQDGRITADLKAIIWDDYKLIVDRKRATAELYSLSDDPSELTNIAMGEPEIYERLKLMLTRFVAEGEAAHPLPGR